MHGKILSNVTVQSLHRRELTKRDGAVALYIRAVDILAQLGEGDG